jgi:xylulokinase
MDAGTSRFKAAAIRPDGTLVARSDRRYSAAADSDRVHEYSTEDLMGAFTETVGDLKRSMGDEPILGIGITGHGPTLMPVDARGQPLHPGVGYLDDRVKSFVRRLAEDREDRITSTMYIPIALFFKEKLDRVYESTATFFQPFDFLAYKLTGKSVASSSSSGIKPWELSKIDQAGLDRGKFPDIRYMGEEIGRTSEAGGRAVGLPPHVPVYAIGVDFAAALVGTDMLSPGRSCERAGSSGGINLCWDRPVHDGRLLCYEHFIRGTWNVAGITSTYGKALEWARKALDAEGFERERLKRKPPGIIFLPYLKGERTPLWDPYARGVFFGMRLEHDGIDLMMSVYTGVAMSIRDCIDIIESVGCRFDHPIVTTGGLTRDDWFMQLKADVTGKTFAQTQLDDAELLGIAIVVSASQGHYASLTEAASRIVRERRRFTPRAEESARYDSLFGEYRTLRSGLQGHF